jgi:histidinol dehydrogenase
MLATPAKIAGCREIVLCTPPDRQGRVNPAILVAARIAGVDKIFKAGGVQAIGAMAYGTETVPKVYKIFGPGNQYVMAAKQQVSLHDVAIDMPAGPSEVCVIADDTANIEFVAADLLSQAEHGVDSQVFLITTSHKVIDDVQKEVSRQLDLLPRKEIAQRTLEIVGLVGIALADLTDEGFPAGAADVTPDRVGKVGLHGQKVVPVVFVEGVVAEVVRAVFAVDEPRVGVELLGVIMGVCIKNHFALPSR